MGQKGMGVFERPVEAGEVGERGEVGAEGDLSGAVAFGCFCLLGSLMPWAWRAFKASSTQQSDLSPLFPPLYQLLKKTCERPHRHTLQGGGPLSQKEAG